MQSLITRMISSPVRSVLRRCRDRRRIARLAQTYLAQGDHVLFTYDTHDDLYLETREGRALPIPHCNPNETGWRLYGKTQALCCETCANHQIHTVCKHTFGMPPAELTKLGQELPGLREIMVVGVVTNMCVLSNAVLLQAQWRRRRSRWTPRSAAASTPCCMRKRSTSCRDCR